MEWWVVVMMSAIHQERPILGCSSRRTSGSKTRKASQSFKVLYFKNTRVKIPLIKAHNLFFFLRAPKYSLFLNEILKLKVLTICQCGTSDRRRQENIGSRVSCKYFQQQFRTPEKNGQYSCKHFLAFFFQEPFIPWQQAMAALVGFSSMEQGVPIIHKDNICKHTLGFIWKRFVFFSTSKVFPPQAPCLSNVLGGQRVRCKNECLEENSFSIICDCFLTQKSIILAQCNGGWRSSVNSLKLKLNYNLKSYRHFICTHAISAKSDIRPSMRLQLHIL